MEGQTLILWNFLETAFRTGTIDEVLNLVQVMTGEEDEDMSEMFADLEEWFLERDDLSSVDDAFGIIYPLMKELTDDETMEGIGILVSLIIPVIKSVKDKNGIDSLLSPEIQADVKDKARKVLNSLKSIGATGVKMYMATLKDKSAYDIGSNIGKSLNSISRFINNMYDEDTDFVSNFMTGLFSSTDGKAIEKMADSLTNGFLDQKPPLFKWTVKTAVKRTKKRLLNR
ncbi:MAG: hypothetical protein KJ737_27460 [Proteobacteria bacterium]|nr:hypothetical protein [Pseudomonadota bacterium]